MTIHPLLTLALAASLLALIAPVALAGGGGPTAIVVLPSQPVTSPPTASIPNRSRRK